MVRVLEEMKDNKASGIEEYRWKLLNKPEKRLTFYNTRIYKIIYRTYEKVDTPNDFPKSIVVTIQKRKVCTDVKITKVP